jgi:hypothetical protein
MAEDPDAQRDALARHLLDAGWQVVAAVHSRSGVELRLHPALHVWDFPGRGQRFAYGRDDREALHRFARQLGGEPRTEPEPG